jgi:hypothetical protein
MGEFAAGQEQPDAVNPKPDGYSVGWTAGGVRTPESVEISNT